MFLETWTYLSIFGQQQPVWAWHSSANIVCPLPLLLFSNPPFTGTNCIKSILIAQRGTERPWMYDVVPLRLFMPQWTEPFCAAASTYAFLMFCLSSSPPRTSTRIFSSLLETFSTPHIQQPWQMTRTCAMSCQTCSNALTSWPMRWGQHARCITMVSDLMPHRDRDRSTFTCIQMRSTCTLERLEMADPKIL